MGKKAWLLILTLTISLLVSYTSARNKKPTPTPTSLFYSHLQYDYYAETCPRLENIILTKMKKWYNQRPDVAPVLLRLLFHDCFIKGCDASVLLDRANGFEVEKDASPNLTLKGFDIIEDIKSEIERVCPETVSCADILALAARDGVAMVGGPFYPLYTGRRDSKHSFPSVTTELPNPQDNISTIRGLFNSRGFTDRDTTALFGAHSIGTIHCQFFRNRLYNFNRTGQPDPSLDTGFLNRLRNKCTTKTKNMTEEPGMELYDDMADGSAFSNHYYTGLMKGKSILRADEQLMANNETVKMVQAYSSDVSVFRRDFARAMTKLSHYQVLTFPRGQIRQKCSMVLKI